MTTAGRVATLSLRRTPIERRDLMETAMRWKLLVSAVAIVGVAAGASSCARSSTRAAQSSGTRTSSPAGTAAGRGGSSAGGRVHFTAYTDSDGPFSTAVLTGAIADYGKAVRTSAGGAGGGQYNQLRVEVSHGSFILDIAALESGLVTAFATFPTDPSTCSGQVVVRRTAPIVANSGTGSYARISGSFALVVAINEVDPWPHCPATSQALLTQTIFLAGTGTVAFN
jgi:hypothetical protein